MNSATLKTNDNYKRVSKFMWLCVTLRAIKNLQKKQEILLCSMHVFY